MKGFINGIKGSVQFAFIRYLKDNTHRVRRGVLRIHTRRVRGDSRRGEQLSGSRTGGGPRRGGGSRHTSCGAPRCGAGSGSRGGGCAPNKAVNDGPQMCPEKAPCLLKLC